VALPDGIRHSQLYQNLVDATLRFLIEQVGGVEGVYKADTTLPDDFLVRRTAGNAVEALGIVAFRASPVWIFAALADLCGMGRQLIPEIAEALKAQGLLDNDAQFATVESVTGRSRTNVFAVGLDHQHTRRSTWPDCGRNGRPSVKKARALPPASLPVADAIGNLWAQLKAESTRQNRSIFETSSVMAVVSGAGGPRRHALAVGVRARRRGAHRAVFRRSAA
jgi:hypothetical protein